jgi:hypothetical protein
VWRAALERVARSAEDAGAVVRGASVSPLRGAEGNVEFFLHLDVVGAPPEASEAVPRDQGDVPSSEARALIARTVDPLAHRGADR